MDSLNVPPPTTKDTQAYRIANTLMDLLNDNSVPQALWWLDDHTFAADPKYFQTQVLDPYFRGTKYASFLRTMHKMGFARLSRRFDLPKGVVAYACELFRKEKPELMHKIRMCNSGKQAQALKEAMAKAKQQQQQAAKTPASPEVKPKEAKEDPSSPVAAAAAKKSVVDTPSSTGSQKKTTSASAVELLQASPRLPSGAVRDLLDAKSDSTMRLQLMREQAALELNAQRMFLQRQQLQQQENLRLFGLLHPTLPQPLPMAPTSQTANLLELARIQESLANRLGGRR